MSERGVFAVDRGIFDHPFFAPEPLTEREAWTWLISEAAWKARTRRVGKFVVKLARGELASSHMYLAEKWRWSKPRIGRFLNRLKIEAMIETRTETGITIIKICKYNKFQRVGLPSETANETTNETVARRERDKTETLKTLETLVSGADQKNEGETTTSKVVQLRREYAWEGRNLKLTTDDHDRWKRQFPQIADLSAELALADDYYTENPRPDGKYFFTFARWLAKANSDAPERRKQAMRLSGEAW